MNPRLMDIARAIAALAQDTDRLRDNPDGWLEELDRLVEDAADIIHDIQAGISE